MPRLNDVNKSILPFDQHTTLLAVIEMSQSSWLLAGIIPGVERHPLKKLEPDEQALLQLLQRWRAKAAKAGSRSRALRSPSRRVATGFGWHDGYERAM
jgi:transposase